MPVSNIEGYKGFSSKNFERKKTFTINDVEVVKNDLLNHIFTRRGERVRMSNFGTRIPDLQYQPLDDITISIIEEDLTTVFTYDPRVTLKDMQMIPLYEESAVIVFANLYFQYLDFTDQLEIKIEFDI